MVRTPPYNCMVHMYSKIGSRIYVSKVCCSAASHTIVSELSFMEIKSVGITDNQKEASFSSASSMQHFSAGVWRFCTLLKQLSLLLLFLIPDMMWSQG